MLHAMKQNVRDPVIPHRHAFPGVSGFIGPFDSL